MPVSNKRTLPFFARASVVTALLFMLLLGVMMSLSVLRVQAQTFGDSWLGQYYNNPDFSGSPSFSRLDSQINFNFGAGSPVSGFINPNNFSIRWTTTEDFSEGRYRFTVVVQDGARVVIDGQIIIDQLGNTGSQQSFSADYNVPEGIRQLQVDFVAREGNSAVQFFWTPLEALPDPEFTPGPTATPAPTSLPAIAPGALAGTVIRARVLNVRDAPSLGGNVIDRVFRGQTYAIVGRDPDARWFLIQMADKQGWVFGYYIFTNLNEFIAPVVSASSVMNLPPGVNDTGVLGQTRAGLRMRGEPNLNSEQTGRIDWGAFLPIVGRTSGGDWYQVVWKGSVGWVFSGFVNIRYGDLNNVPVR